MKGSAGFQSDERHFLYREYLRIVASQQPPVFVMENVKGLLSSSHSVESTFERICADLRYPGKAVRINKAGGIYYDLYACPTSTRFSVGDSHFFRFFGFIIGPHRAV